MPNNNLILRTLEQLATSNIASACGVEELHLSRYFTTVKLRDGSVGACMSYYVLDDTTLRICELALFPILSADALAVLDQRSLLEVLVPYVPDQQTRILLLTSVTTTVASALSAPIIKRGGDEHFSVARRCGSRRYEDAEYVLIVGFGGALSEVAQVPGVRTIRIIDLTYRTRSHQLGTVLARLRANYPDRRFDCSTSVTTEEMRTFDLILVTGSVLCNDTLDGFLEGRRSTSRLALTGQSASVYPRALFDVGVDWILTTLKPPEVGCALRNDYSGKSLRRWMEGGLPWIELCPCSQSRVPYSR